MSTTIEKPPPTGRRSATGASSGALRRSGDMARRAPLLPALIASGVEPSPPAT